MGNILNKHQVPDKWSKNRGDVDWEDEKKKVCPHCSTVLKQKNKVTYYCPTCKKKYDTDSL